MVGEKQGETTTNQGAINIDITLTVSTMTKRKQRFEPSSGGDRRRRKKKGSDQITGEGDVGGLVEGASSLSTTNTAPTSRRYHNNPRRGGPAFIVTCERGREFKARRDALEILQHYYDDQQDRIASEASREDGDGREQVEGEDEHKVASNGCNSTNETLSFEDELKFLQDQNKKHTTKTNNSNNSTMQKSSSSSYQYRRFTEFETSIRGVVVLMYNDLDSTQYQSRQIEDGNAQEPKHGDDEENDTRQSNGSSSTSSRRWDPIDTFERIYADWKADAEFQKATKKKEEGEEKATEGNVDKQKAINPAQANRGDLYAPCSRYITRMIPIQMTCFSSVDDIKLTVPKLLQKYFPPTTTKATGNKEDVNDTAIITTTYAVAVKIRNCRMIKRQDVIDIVAGYMLQNYCPKNYQVQLENPDVTILVEICQTLCGMSVIHHKINASTSISSKAGEKIVRNPKDHNFNLAMIKERC